MSTRCGTRDSGDPYAPLEAINALTDIVWVICKWRSCGLVNTRRGCSVIWAAWTRRVRPGVAPGAKTGFVGVAAWRMAGDEG